MYVALRGYTLERLFSPFFFYLASYFVPLFPDKTMRFFDYSLEETLISNKYAFSARILD